MLQGRGHDDLSDQPTVPYRDVLPNGCPPEDAEEIKSDVYVYRFVDALPPTEDDFRSQRQEKPLRIFKNVDECVARGISVLTTIERVEQAKTLPTLRNKQVCKVRLSKGAGKVGRCHNAHRTWWPYAAYKILAGCVSV